MTAYRSRKKIYRLIFEGNNKTERIFFQHLVRPNSSYHLIDQIPENPRTDPKSLFEFGLDEIEKHHMTRSLGDRVFVIMDLDHRPDHQRFVRENALRNRLIVFVPSQPCVEAFFLLHFQDLNDLSKTGDEVLTELKKYIQNYNKSLDVFSQLEGRNDLATKRLRKLDKKEKIKGTLNIPDLIDLLKK
jgi:hypothetical protein